MSQSILNSSIRQASNLQFDKKDSQLIPLYSGNKVNPTIKSMMRSIKNSFGVVTCIGSEQFYVFTRQMLLHLDFSKALNLTEEEYDDLDYYKSQQFERDNNCSQVNSPKRVRKARVNDDMETSFAKGNAKDIKNMLEAQLLEIQSDYQLSHNQLVDKDLDQLKFKKTYSSVAPQVSPSFKTKSRQSIVIHKNKQQIILNQVDLLDDPLSQTHQLYDRPSPIMKSRSVKFIDESFHKDVENFKQSMEKKKIEEIMRKKGCVKVMVNGEERFVPKNDFLRLYNSKEIGTDKEKRPIEWVYSEVKVLTQQAIETAYLISSTIVYELPFTKEPSADEFQKQIKQYLQFYRKIEAQINKYDDSNSDMPQIVIVCPVQDSQQADSVKNNFRAIFSQLQMYIIPQTNKKNLNYFQSPFSQFHKSNSPSKSKLPPTPKRMMPVSHRNSQSSTGNGSKRKVRLQFRVISEELSKSGVLRENYSRMREITSQGRDIFNQQSLKTLCGNWVSSSCYINLLQRISDHAPSIQIEQFYQHWSTVYQGFIKSTMQDAAQKYQQKVNQLIVGKTIISQSRLTQIHQVAKKQTLRQFSQKKIGTSRVFIESNKQIKSGVRLPSYENISNSRRISISRKLVESRKELFLGDHDLNNEPEFSQEELINLVESRIQQQKEQLATKTKHDAMKWCRKFLSSQYEQVKKKLLNNQIKSIVNFRQQLQFLRETYKKKLQNHSALEYEMMEEFNSFMMDNLFSGIEVLNERERNEWKEKVRKEIKNSEDMELQVKELKRSLLAKERALAEQKAQQQNKLQELQASIQTLSSELEVKAKEINYLKTQYQEQMTQKQAQAQKKLQGIKKQLQQARKQTDSKSSDLMYLQSQLQKQQLLHQQTHSNYQQILVTYKNNVTQLEKKLKELKQSSSIAQQQLKNSINKEQIDTQLIKYKQQADQKVQSLQKLIQQKTKMIHQQAQQMNQRLQESAQQIKQLQTQKSQLEIQAKLKQEQMIELQSRMEKYKHTQMSLEKYQQQIDALTHQLQSLANQNALLQQKLTLSTQSSQQTLQKLNQTHSKQLQTLKQQLTQLTTRNQTYRKKLYQPKTQTQSQTTFTVDKQQDIMVKAKCKNCKENKIKLVEAMKIAQGLNENYQKLKNTFLAKGCFHCSEGNSKILGNNSSMYNKTTVNS